MSFCFVRKRLVTFWVLAASLGLIVWHATRSRNRSEVESSKRRFSDSAPAEFGRDIPEVGFTRQSPYLRPPESSVFSDAACNGLVRDDFQSYRELVNHFETKGALASIVLAVVDENGNPVSSANVRVSFTRPGDDGEYSVKSGKTDKEGRFSAEGLSCWKVAWYVEKAGFYSYSSNLLLRPFLSASGKNEGRWFQAPYPVQAILLKKETPHEMLFRDVKVPLPPPGQAIGFDLLEGVPTPPHGPGTHIDVEITADFNPDDWKPRSRKDRKSTIRLSFPGKDNGGVLIPVDEASEMHNPRFSPNNGYFSSLESTVRVENGRLSKRDMIHSDQYILFRTRSEHLPDGTLTNGLFGKMRGDWYVNGPKRLLCFRIWVNEEVGNRNLEDTSGWW